jgi:hypothetical protein
MKKFVIFALVLVLALTMFACGKKAEPAAPTTEPTEPTETTETPAPEPTEHAEQTEEPDPVEPSAESILGSWTLKTMEGEGLTLDAAALGVEMIFDFRDNGTVVISSEGEDSTDPYTFADNTIVITEETGDVQGVYDPKTDTLAFEQDNVKLVFVRTGSETAETEPTQAPEKAPVDATEEDMAGTWTLTKAIVSGIEVPASTMGTEMTFVFQANGTGAMVYNGNTTEGLNWTVAEGTVKLSAGTMELYDLVFDGTVLTLHEETTGIDMVFEKAAE